MNLNEMVRDVIDGVEAGSWTCVVETLEYVFVKKYPDSSWRVFVKFDEYSAGGGLVVRDIGGGYEESGKIHMNIGSGFKVNRNPGEGLDDWVRIAEGLLLKDGDGLVERWVGDLEY